MHLPADEATTVTESGRPLSHAEGVRTVAEKDGAVQVEVGSGRYTFRVT